MGNKTLIYRQKIEQNLAESKKHLKRVNDAFSQIKKKYKIPLDKEDYQKIQKDLSALAYSDQIIYRFSKLQDSMGAKLFKSTLLFQGENINKPFLDILNTLEKMEIINVDDWFEIRDLRNEIAHEYDENSNLTADIINMIYELKSELQTVLNKIETLLKNSTN